MRDRKSLNNLEGRIIIDTEHKTSVAINRKENRGVSNDGVDEMSDSSVPSRTELTSVTLPSPSAAVQVDMRRDMALTYSKASSSLASQSRQYHLEDDG